MYSNNLVAKLGQRKPLGQAQGRTQTHGTPLQSVDRGKFLHIVNYKLGVVVFTLERPCGWKRVVIAFCISFVENLFVKHVICQAIYLSLSKATKTFLGMLYLGMTSDEKVLALLVCEGCGRSPQLTGRLDLSRASTATRACLASSSTPRYLYA
jgi:hypothetical protein